MNYKVLIVEDDPMVAMINSQFVAKVDGFEVAGMCRNGQEALDYLIDNINTWYLEPALFNDYDTEDIDETIEGEEAYESEEGNTEESTDE